MLLLSIPNESHNRPLRLVSARLDGVEEPKTTASRKSGEREIHWSPSASSLGKSRLTSSQTLWIEDLIQDITIYDPNVPRQRIGEKIDTTESARPLSFQLDSANSAASPATTTVADQALSRTRRKKSTKCVSFSAVHICEHAITVGDHDWCEGQLPIELDWKHTKIRSIPLDDFEWQRQRQGRTPRGRLPKLDYQHRKRLLRRVSGITEEDLLLLERQRIDSKYVTLHCSKTVTLFNKSR